MIINGQSFFDNSSRFNEGLNKNIYLFKINNFDPIFLSAKIKDFKIYKDNILVRDYIPTVEAESQRPCLFDKVEKNCYYNQGTGEFLWG